MFPNPFVLFVDCIVLLLSTRPGQWLCLKPLRRFTGGWVFSRHGFPGFIAPRRDTWLRYQGDTTGADPTTMLTDRRQWSTWIVVTPEGSSAEGYFTIRNFRGRRLVYLGRSFNVGEKVAFRVGHEDAHALFVCHQGGIPPMIKLIEVCPSKATLELQHPDAIQV